MLEEKRHNLIKLNSAMLPYVYNCYEKQSDQSYLKNSLFTYEQQEVLLFRPKEKASSYSDVKLAILGLQLSDYIFISCKRQFPKMSFFYLDSLL